jgi:hypothetical protein
VLGRVRYPDRPATPNPVPALLTQLTPRPPLAELAAESLQLRARLGASLLPVGAKDAPAAAFRLRDDTAVALIPPAVARAAGVDGFHETASGAGRKDGPGADGPGAAIPLASDAATGLTLLRVRPAATQLAPAPWTPRALDEPRYLMASIATGDAVALRPVFVASLHSAPGPGWSTPVWVLPRGTDAQAGAFVFTTDAQLAGLVVPHDGGLAIVPATTLLADAQRLRERQPPPPGALGLEVQPLTPDLSQATGARQGVVVSWVDPSGPAAGQLSAGDVIEAADGQWLPSRAHWDVRAARTGAGERIVLGVRRNGEWRDVQIVASAAGRALPLGLALRRVPNVGSEVVGVDRPSAGAAAGLEPGDVITRIGPFTAPTPGQVREAFKASSDGAPALVAFSRGTTGRVATIHP